MTLGTQVDTLEAKGLIRLAAVQPEIEYLFRHALVQDAAYGSLLKQERRGLHQQVGEALEDLYPDRREELAAVLAMHFEQAGETDKAIDYLVAAGNYGVQRNAIREAYDAFDRAAALLPAEGPGNDPDMRRREVQIKLGRIQAGYSFIDAEGLLLDLEALVPRVEQLGDDQLTVKVHSLVALYRLQAGEEATSPIVARSLERIGEIGRRLGDRSLGALPLALIGMTNVFMGRLRDGVRQLAEAVPQLEEGDDSIGAAFARGALGLGHAYLGDFDKAQEAMRNASEVAAKGDIIAQLDAMIMESMVRSAMDDLEGAVPIASDCVQKAEQTGASACILASSWVLGDAFHRQGRFDEAREILQRGADVSGVVDRKVWRPTLKAWLSTTLAALGNEDIDFDEALATARSIKNVGGEAGILVKRAEAAARRGDIEAAIADYKAGTEIHEREGARPLLARALREWGEALRGAGRAADAEPLLRRSLALFEELKLDREAREVRTALSIGGATLAFD